MAFYASAETRLLPRLGWPKPANILDLFTEFRDRTNGLSRRRPAPAWSARLTYFGLDSIAAQEKDRLRLLVLRGGPWSASERAEILDYCATDTEPLKRLLSAMLPRIDLAARTTARSLHGRGSGHGIQRHTDRHCHAGGSAGALVRHIQDQLIAAIDVDYGVFDGRTFKAATV